MEIGKTLRSARENQGITLEFAEQETKIRKKYLVALEQENFDIIPGKVYVRGFLRNYARFLGIDGEELVSSYDEQFKPTETSEEEIEEITPGVGKSSGFFGRRRIVMTALVGIILVAGLAMVLGIIGGAEEPEKEFSQGIPEQTEGNESQTGENGDSGEPEPHGVNPKSGAVNDGEQGSVQQEGIHVVLSFNDRCWMRIRVDNNEVFEGFAGAGDQKDFEGEESITVRLGNAGAVRAIINGVDKGFLGERGQTLETTFRAAENADS